MTRSIIVASVKDREDFNALIQNVNQGCKKHSNLTVRTKGKFTYHRLRKFYKQVSSGTAVLSHRKAYSYRVKPENIANVIRFIQDIL